MKDFESTENKNSLRILFKQKREEFRPHSKDASEGICKNLLKLLPHKSEKYWATYRPCKSEANPTSVESQTSISWCYPVVDGETLNFYSNKDQRWVINSFKIEEPITTDQRNKKIPLNDIEGVLLPGLAFDLKGQRLGSGKAFYDKTLRNYSGLKVGVAYSIQITESLPTSEHDIPVDYIVTEKEIFTISKVGKAKEGKIL